MDHFFYEILFCPGSCHAMSNTCALAQSIHSLYSLADYSVPRNKQKNKHMFDWCTHRVSVYVLVRECCKKKRNKQTTATAMSVNRATATATAAAAKNHNHKNHRIVPLLPTNRTHCSLCTNHRDTIMYEINFRSSGLL